MSESSVRADLDAVNGDVAALMTKYGKMLQDILDQHGGNISDVPMDPHHAYHRIQDDIQILGRMAPRPKRLEPVELEKKRKELKDKGRI